MTSVRRSPSDSFRLKVAKVEVDKDPVDDEDNVPGAAEVEEVEVPGVTKAKDEAEVEGPPNAGARGLGTSPAPPPDVEPQPWERKKCSTMRAAKASHILCGHAADGPVRKAPSAVWPTSWASPGGGGPSGPRYAPALTRLGHPHYRISETPSSLASSRVGLGCGVPQLD